MSRPADTDDGSVVVLGPGCWELVTETGTRHLLDLRTDDRRRIRFPGPGREQSSSDGVWQDRVGVIHHQAMELADDYGHDEVVIGEPAILPGPGLGDHWTTTRVVSVRALTDDEILTAQVR